MTRRARPGHAVCPACRSTDFAWKLSKFVCSCGTEFTEYVWVDNELENGEHE